MQAVIADARALIRLGLIQVLRDIEPGIGIHEVEKVETLLDTLGSSAPDLIILGLELDDLALPDGMEAILQRAPESRLIVVSEREDPRLVEQCFAFGAVGYLPTGLRREVATNAIRLVLAGDKYLPSALLRPANHAALAEDLRPFDGAASAARSLTRRQQEVLRLLAAGRSNKEIAQSLGLAEGTVKIHVSAILKALGVGNRTEATVRALNAG